MGFSFFPREESFFDLFLEAAKNIHEAGRLLKAMVENYDKPPEMARQIKDKEHEGDRLTHELIKRLNKTFLTPFDREDIHALASALDDVLDLIEGAADRMVVYKIEKQTPEARQLADLIYQSTKIMVEGVGSLRKLHAILPHCVEINRLENEADRVSRDAVARLFAEQHDPIFIIKWKEIYETLEEATDRCEDVANVLEGVALKNA